MSWEPDRVVVIAKKVDDGYELIGSGAIVADRRVLTALHVVSAHVVVDADTRATTHPLFARRDGSQEFHPLGALLWRGDDTRDAAVFAWEVGRTTQGHACEVFFPNDLAEGIRWYARGYPMLNPRLPHSTLAKLGGTIARFYPRHDTEIELPVTVRPEKHEGYGGLSGAAVMDGNDCVVGVVKAVADPTVWNGQKLTAVPAALLLKDEGFRVALGAPPSTTRLQQRLDAVIADIGRLIDKRTSLAEALAQELALDASGGLLAVVDRVVGTVSAVNFARALHKLHDRSREPDERRVLESLFWKALRYAADWRAELEQNVARFEDPASPEPARLKLRCWSKSVATVVLAGLDDTDVTFLSEQTIEAPQRPELRGAGFVNVPATELAPIFSRQGTTAARGVVTHLAREIGHPSLHRLIDSSRPDDYRKVCEYVAHVLHRNTYDPTRPGQRAPRYLVVDALDLREHGADAFEVLAKEVHRVLPSLRIVLLEGIGIPDFNAEDDLDDAIVWMNRNRTP